MTFYNDLNNNLKDPTFAEMFWMERGRIQERDRIMNRVQDIEDRSHATRTPLFQETLLELIRDVVLDKDISIPPRRFRDIANGE